MKKIKLPKQIASESDVEQFYQQCVQIVGIGFSCDQSFRDYLSYSFEAGMSMPMFDELIVEEYESFNLQCFGFCLVNNLNVKAICVKALTDVVEELTL